MYIHWIEGGGEGGSVHSQKQDEKYEALARANPQEQEVSLISY